MVVLEQRRRGGVIADAIGAGKTVVSIALIMNNIESAHKQRGMPNKSWATLVAVPPGLIDQWHPEIKKFAEPLRVVKVYDFASLLKMRRCSMLTSSLSMLTFCKRAATSSIS